MILQLEFPVCSNAYNSLHKLPVYAQENMDTRRKYTSFVKSTRNFCSYLRKKKDFNEINIFHHHYYYYFLYLFHQIRFAISSAHLDTALYSDWGISGDKGILCINKLFSFCEYEKATEKCQKRGKWSGWPYCTVLEMANPVCQ